MTLWHEIRWHRFLFSKFSLYNFSKFALGTKILINLPLIGFLLDFCPALTKLALDLHVNFCLFVCLSVCLSGCISGLFFCLNDQAHFAWFTSGVARGQLGGSSGAEQDLWRKTTFDGRRPYYDAIHTQVAPYYVT